MSSTSALCKPKHVIFRSRGCKTCRARKVKCDETRPVCQRCIHSNFQCQGYSEPTTFLSDNPRHKNEVVSWASTSYSRDTQRNSGTQVAKSLLYSAEFTHIAFLERKLNIGTPGDRKGFSWLRVGLESPDKTSLIYISSRCLASVYFGRLLHRDNIVIGAMTRYGNILEALRKQLDRPRLLQDNNLMSVIMVSVVIESVVSQSAAGFHAHLRGLAEFVRRAGPEAFMLRPNVIFFEFCRCLIVGRAIMGRHSTFLADNQWKSIPWTYEPKRSIVKLWDIICDLPSIALNLKRLEDGSGLFPLPLPTDALESLKQEIISLLQKLFDWRWEWEKEYNHDIEEFPANSAKTSLIDVDGSSRYATLITFPNQWRALEVIYYNATLVHLSRICNVLGDYSLLEGTNRAAPSWIARPLCKSPLKLPDDLVSIEDALSEFYRSLDGYLCSPRWGAGDLYQLMFSLSLVKIRMHQNHLEAIWKRRLEAKIVALSGLDMWAAARRSI